MTKVKSFVAKMMEKQHAAYMVRKHNTDVDPSSMDYYFPVIWEARERLGLNIPDTIRVAAEGFSTFHFIEPEEMDEEQEEACFDFLNALKDAVRALADRSGQAFLRTSIGSGKHEWRHTCAVTDPNNIEAHLAALVEWSETVDFFGMAHDVFYVRRWIESDARFKAFEGMPVGSERRYFARDGKVICHHPYWPEMSILNPSLENWKDLLAGANEETLSEYDYLGYQAAAVSRLLPGHAWSIDFMRDNSGKWWLIDMAVMERSFHWEGCPNARGKRT